MCDKPQVVKANRIEAGSCDCCHTDRSNLVYRIILERSELRVCTNCKMELQHLLRDVNKQSLPLPRRKAGTAPPNPHGGNVLVFNLTT